APAAPAPATPAPAAPAPSTAAPAAPAAPSTTTPSAPAAATAAAKYVVTKGDSLWKIAEEKYGKGIDWKKIAEANELRRPNHIEVGEELNIPAN
ncbi:LysM peptidoglycan-binding domain-containing protein, partial [Agrobacterium cavarae]|uniref:LysM peptidoglycan-binding domain-containing protein n=1 Tax=Agrobacterium cavarae TaxID=2528239 RepID=UPI0028A896D1